MGQVFWKVLAGFGGAAALFYALGFTVVQSYVYKNGFEGMFWFTNEFYRDAGAVFILDLIRVPMLAPYIFFPYFLILFLLIPKEENLRLFKEAGTSVSKAHWTKTLVLLAIMTLTAMIALYYETVLGKKFVIRLIDLLRRSSEHTSTQPEQSLAFCSLVTPIIAVVSIFLYKHWKCLMPGCKGREFYGSILILYMVFLFIIPVTYGFYLYDVKIVPIKDSQLVSCKTDLVPDAKDDEIWLLGEFGEKYVFFRKVKNSLSSQGIIETYDVKEIKHLNFDIKRTSTLKVHMKDYVPETSKAQTMDWIMEDMAQ
jgi:hypothetical protein